MIDSDAVFCSDFQFLGGYLTRVYILEKNFRLVHAIGIARWMPNYPGLEKLNECSAPVTSGFWSNTQIRIDPFVVTPSD